MAWPFRPSKAVAAEIAFWDGLAVPTEWFYSADGTSALGLFGAAVDQPRAAQVVAIDEHADGTVTTSATDPVEFSTGGPET